MQQPGAIGVLGSGQLSLSAIQANGTMQFSYVPTITNMQQFSTRPVSYPRSVNVKINCIQGGQTGEKMCDLNW